MRNFSNLLIACGKPSIEDEATNSRIISGYEVTPHSIPWQAQVITTFKSGTKARCGGSLIDSRNVLSAAHCVATPWQDQLQGHELIFVTDPTKFVVILGQHQSMAGIITDGLNVTVCRVLIHKSLQNAKDLFTDLDNDFVILLLTNPVTFNDKISPVCLPTPNMDDHFLVNKTLLASGWGVGSQKESLPKYKTLHAVKLLGVSNEMCSKAHSDADIGMNPNIIITRNMLCAGYLNETKSICAGDSGGRLSSSSIAVYLKDIIDGIVPIMILIGYFRSSNLQQQR